MDGPRDKLLIPAEYSVVFGHSKCLARAGAARCAPTLYFANINSSLLGLEMSGSKACATSPARSEALSWTAYWPAFLTTWRGKVLERTVNTRRAPLGALGHGMPCPYILEPYVEHGEQAQRSSGGPIACFGRQVVRNAGWWAFTAVAKAA